MRRCKPAYSPNPREQPDGTWLCDSERYGGFIEYMQWIDGDGGIHCNCESGRWDRPCKHGRAVHAQLHPPVVAEPAALRMPHLDWFTCKRCGTVAWMPAGWECSCKPKPEPTRPVEVHEGWDYKPAPAELMEAFI